MQTETKTDEVTSALAQLRFLKGSLLMLLAWPALCLVLGTLVWTITLSRLDTEQEAVHAQAMADASHLAKSYADQLARTIEQVDQITLNLRYYWKRSGGALRLEDQANEGLYPANANFSIAIYDRDGKVITSLLKNGAMADIADRAYFQAHKSGLAAGLQIEKVARGRITGRPVVVFSRGLTDAAGRFDGLIYVAAMPAVLTAFYDQAGEREHDVLALMTKAGATIASRMGKDSQASGSFFKQPLSFSTRSGTLDLSPDQSSDERARVLAWESLEKYPFVSVAALGEEELYASYASLRRDYMGMAATASILLTFIGIMGSVFMARLTWRKHQAAVITDTYRLATEGAREGFFMARAMYARDGRITDFVVENCNERGAAMVGYDKHQLIGLRFSQLYSGRGLQLVMAPYLRAMQDGFHEDDFRQTTSGTVLWLNRRLVRSGDGIAVNFQDITAAKAHERALQNLVNADPLTSLPNRYWLTQFLPECLANAQAHRMRVAVLYMDLDDFKNVNNTMGHAAGDEVLCQAGQRMQSVIGPDDHVVRLGGDEFTVVLPAVSNAQQAAEMANRILEALSRPFLVSGGFAHLVRASVGISMFPEDGRTVETLLKHADTAMYAAKGDGKGCMAYYSPALTQQIVERINNEQALRQAVDQRQFVLHYQPRVDAASGELISMEALIRWIHPQRGMVPPLEFIPLAEETGLIVQIGEFVIDEACAQIASWQKQHLGAVPLSVNVSPRQFAHYDLKSVLAAAIAHHGISSSMLEIEITESCMMQEGEQVARDIDAIKAIGIRVSVDDFGTGYSSLSQLQRLDLDVLKVDRAFTRELANGKTGRDFFMTIVSMAHILDMRVVAEGVETLEQLTILQSLGCNEVQGYFISRPVPAAEAIAFLGRASLFPATCRELLEV